jgi:hypothetical protein
MGSEPRIFHHISLLGFLIQKKMSSRSQFIPDLTIPVEKQELLLHSQTGDGYHIAELGDYEELLDRLAKYDHESSPIDRDIAKFCINYFLDRISSCSLVPKEEAFQNLNKNASLGFAAKKSGLSSRKDLDLATYLDSYLEMSTHSVPRCIVNAAQKDELRVDGKTPRLFTSFPVEHTYLSAIVFGDFLRQFYENRFCINKTVSAVGDAMQNGALATYKYELSKRKYLYCSDTSGQDSSVSPEFMHLVFGQLRALYEFDDESSNMFETIRENSINKVISVNGLLYLVPVGLGSGDYLTVVINIMWRLYMAVKSYSINHDYKLYFEHNTTIINGDDYISSSDYGDLNLSSEHATIEWSGRPSKWSEMDFCSCKFYPYVHHDEKKVLSVLEQRKKRSQSFSPVAEMQRLGGLLHTLSTHYVYSKILYKMMDLMYKHDLKDEFCRQFISYKQLFINYNCDYEFH